MQDDNRREHPREEIRQKSVFLFKTREIPCLIENISRGGALLFIEQAQSRDVTHDDIGEEIELHVPPEYFAFIKGKGRIIRLFQSGSFIAIAVFFI